MLSSPMLQFLESFLNVAANRHSIITTNMANIDTPGYHTQDIDFHAALQQAVGDPQGASLMPVSHSVPGLVERPDGNNVSLDRESVLLAETQLQFRLGIQFIRSQFHQLLSAISEGQSQ